MIPVVRNMQCGVISVQFAHFVHLVANALATLIASFGSIEIVPVVGLFSCRVALALCDALGSAREALNRLESEKIAAVRRGVQSSLARHDC